MECFIALYSSEHPSGPSASRGEDGKLWPALILLVGPAATANGKRGGASRGGASPSDDQSTIHESNPTLICARTYINYS